MMQYKNDFPLLNETMHGRPLVYLDSSASSQRPQCVLDAMSHYARHDHANVHRGVHTLSQRATEKYEQARITLQHAIHAKHAHDIIFVRGATEGINLVAQSYGRTRWKAGDEIIVSEMEHHSNLVPWQMVCEQVGAVLKVIPVTDSGELDMDQYEKLFSGRTVFVAIAHASNVLGTINPIKEIVNIAHQHAVPVLVDGAQAFPHLPVDVQDLDCDFYVLSSHKAYGPTGIGVFYGKSELLASMPPYQGGGSMIEHVSLQRSTYVKAPYKFEAGTPNIEGAIGLGAAVQYLQKIGMNAIVEHEQALLQYATEKLSNIDGLTLIGTAKKKVGVLSFVIDTIHAHDVGTILDHAGVAVRAGHHCAMPLMERFNIPACVRASFGLYNSADDVDALVAGLMEAKRIFK